MRQRHRVTLDPTPRSRSNAELTSSASRKAPPIQSLLILTGSMGAGKSTVLGEKSDLLALRHIAYAAIDLDALGIAYLPCRARNDGVMIQNLASVCRNYAAQGVKRILLARALEGRPELEPCRGAVSTVNTVVCRLTTSVRTMQQRVKKRELGALQHEFVVRAAKLNATVDRAGLEDFTISNEHRTPADVAKELLCKAGWISD